MSQREFELQIAAIMARLERLQAAQRGDLKVRRILVRAHRVPAYRVGKHYRTIFTKKGKAA